MNIFLLIAKIISKNSKAYHDYFIDSKIECGIELAGTEVKSIRDGKVNMKDSYAHIKDGELFIHSLLQNLKESM